MSTSIREDWTEVGQRINTGIITLGMMQTAPDDAKRIEDKVAGLDYAASIHQEITPRDESTDEQFDAAWTRLADILDGMGGPTSTTSDGYAQGIQLARSYMGGFGR